MEKEAALGEAVEADDTYANRASFFARESASFARWRYGLS